MYLPEVRKYCLSLPHTTETVQWGNHLLFKIGGKMYSIASLEPGGNFLSLKSSPEEFPALTEVPGVIPAPYLARAYWIALETSDALPKSEIRRLLRQAYDLVYAKLPKKLRAELAS